MTKFKQNEVIYRVLMHHINHYKDVKKIFKIDYDSQMILVRVYAHYLFYTINPLNEKNSNLTLEFNEIFQVIENLTNKNKKQKIKLSFFSETKILDMTKETVRKKV